MLLAKAHGAVLDLVHVVGDDRPRRIVDHEAVDARTLLRELAQSLRSADGITCETEVVLSDPFAGIVKAVAEKKPDLLVIGPHRRQILRDASWTTAERTSSVNCPVLCTTSVSAWRHILLTPIFPTSKIASQRFAALGWAGRASFRSSVFVCRSPCAWPCRFNAENAARASATSK